MNKVFLNTAVIIIYLLPYSNQTVKYVNTCPSNAQSWIQRSSTFVCDHPHEEYHCLQNIEHTLIETCMKVYNIPSYKVGCPWVKIYNGKAFLFNPFTTCDPMNSFCPQQSHRKYRSNELYIYPECIKSGIVTVTIGTDSVAERTTITPFTQDRRNGLSSMPQLLPPLLVFGCMIFIPCMLFIGKSLKGKNLLKRSKDPECIKSGIVTVTIGTDSVAERTTITPFTQDRRNGLSSLPQLLPPLLVFGCMIFSPRMLFIGKSLKGKNLLKRSKAKNMNKDQEEVDLITDPTDNTSQKPAGIELDHDIFKATATIELFQNPSPKGCKALTLTTQTGADYSFKPEGEGITTSMRRRISDSGIGIEEDVADSNCRFDDLGQMKASG